MARSADVLFSVSHSILDVFRSTGKRSYFINHELGDAFAGIAARAPEDNYEGKDICYVGNLLIPYMDRQLVKSMIEALPYKRFHFIGPYETFSLGSGDEEARAFISFLQSCSNVVLHGPKNTSEMCRIMEGMVVFILCYTGRKEGYNLSNSHKMLEYLSAGKPVIETPVKAYSGYRHLIVMPPEDMPESEYAGFFNIAILEICVMAARSLAKERKELALRNTYLKQVYRIRDILTQSNLI